MPTVRAKFSGTTRLQVAQFSEDLRDSLRTIYTNRIRPQSYLEQEDQSKEKLDEKISSEESDAFVAAILFEAEWLLSEIAYIEAEATVGEAKKELTEVIKTLTKSIDQLQSLSPNIDRLLSNDDAPELLVDELVRYRAMLLSRYQSLHEYIGNESRAEKTKTVMDEMTARVVEALREFGIAPAATANRELREAAAEKGEDRYESVAVSVLTAISSDLRIPGSPEGWRNRLSRIKKTASQIR